MISTRSIISSINEIPREWVFEHYLNLTESLVGQNIKMRSVFGPSDTTPSMHVFYSDEAKGYRFKDFSTGKFGDGVTLVQEKLSLSSRGESAQKIISDYNIALLSGYKRSTAEIKGLGRYKVTDYSVRNWNTLDQRYWMEYYIGSELLEFYNVRPLLSFKMTKEVDGILHEYVVQGRQFVYGFFRLDGSLYKIYQPMIRDAKFIKVSDYIQGSDQLEMKAPYLAIGSSLKDIMAFKLLRFREIENIAPDSENIIIQPHIMSAYIFKYKRVASLFDNDSAGISCMENYKQQYSLPPIHLKLEKDLSDSIKLYGVDRIRNIIKPILKEALVI